MKAKEFSKYLEKIGCRIECENKNGQKSVELFATQIDDQGNPVLTKNGEPNETSVLRVYSDKKNASYVEMVNTIHLKLMAFGVGYIIMGRVEALAKATTQEAKEEGLMEQ